MSLINKVHSFLTGFTPDTPSASTIVVNGHKIDTLPGLKMIDDLGVKAAKRNGWILSMKQIRYLVTDNTDFFWDILPESAIQPHLTKLANALCKLQADRSGDLKVLLTASERYTVITQLYENLLEGSSLTKDDLKSGYIFLRYIHESPRVTDKNTVDAVIKNFEQRGVLPPIIVTHHAMAYLGNKCNLLKAERVNADCSINFRPERDIQHSTKINDFTSVLEMSQELSEIRCENDTVQGEIGNFMDRTVHELDDPEEMADIVKNVNKTVSKVREFVVKLNVEKERVREGEESILEQLKELNSLNQTLSDTQREQEEKDREIEDLTRDLDDIKKEYSEREAELQKALEEEKQKATAAQLHSIPSHEFNELSEQNEALREENKERTALVTRLRRQFSKLQDDHAIAPSKKETDLDNAKRVKIELRNRLNETKAQIESCTTENETLKSELVKRENDNSRLERELERLKNEVKKTQRRHTTAEESKLNLSLSPSLKRSSRSCHFDTSCQEESYESETESEEMTTKQVSKMLKFPSLPRASVCALTSVEANKMIPKWTEKDTVDDYCDSVRNAWEYCSGEEFDEEKFCKILKVNLPKKALTYVKSLPTAEQLKVDNVLQAITEGLGRRKHAYLQELSRAKKEASETHNEFAQRIKDLYELGTGSRELNEGEKSMIVDFFLKGLSANEESALRLVATDEEMTDIVALAKRAGRTRDSSVSNINAVDSIETKAEAGVTRYQHPNKGKETADGPKQSKDRKKIICHYCKKPGHRWRKCYLRAAKEPEWKPHWYTEDYQPKPKENKVTKDKELA